MDGVLVVVDMQKKFINGCGAQRLVARVADKISRKREEGAEIIFTLDRSGGPFPPPIARAAEGCKVYAKRSYGCKELILDLAQRAPQVIEFAGLCTDICVMANVMGAMAFLPYSEIVVDSACCASSEEGHMAALRVFRTCNITVL